MERPLFNSPQESASGQMTWNDYPPAEGFLPPDPPGYTGLLEMSLQSDDSLFNYISNELAAAEMWIFRDEADIESKLAFLGGRRRWDISKITIAEGKGIYKTTPRYMKNSEIHEFAVVANLVTNEGVPVVDFASEAADIFYNLIRANSLDDYPIKPDYLGIMREIASILGWSEKQALLLAAAKYYRRFIEMAGVKEAQGERKVLEGLFANDIYQGGTPYVSTPNNDQIDSAARRLLKIQKVEIIPRYRKIRDEKEKRGIKSNNGKIIF